MRGADLHHPFHGVAIVTVAPASVAELYSALQTKLPPESYAHGVTAAAIMSIPLPQRLERLRVVHVASPEGRRAVRGRGVVGHSVNTIGDTPRDWKGLRIASPEQVWCELSTALSVPELVAAGDYLIHWRHPLTTIALLAAAVDSFAGHRGVRALRIALALLSDRAESPKESELRVIIVQAGLSGLEVNLPITTSDGYNYRGDLAFPKERVLIEYQGDHHRDPETYRRDMTRASRLEADGWYIINVNANDLRSGDELVTRICRVLRSRA